MLTSADGTAIPLQHALQNTAWWSCERSGTSWSTRGTHQRHWYITSLKHIQTSLCTTKHRSKHMLRAPFVWRGYGIPTGKRWRTGETDG